MEYMHELNSFYLTNQTRSHIKVGHAGFVDAAVKEISDSIKESSL